MTETHILFKVLQLKKATIIIIATIIQTVNYISMQKAKANKRNSVHFGIIEDTVLQMY